MGLMHHLTRYIPHLAQIAVALHPLLKVTENKSVDWKAEHNVAFNNILKLVSDITQIKYFDQNLETQVFSCEQVSDITQNKRFDQNLETRVVCESIDNIILNNQV